MYELGVIDERQVYANYRDLGYNDKNAKLMTEFTVKYAQDEAKSLTKDMIISAYNNRIFTETEAINALVSIGYAHQTANIIISIEKAKDTADTINTVAEGLRLKYVRSQIDESMVYTELSKYNLPSTQISHLVYKWQVEKQKRVKFPSKTDLDRFYKEGLIDSSTYKNILKTEGYNDQVISWYAATLTSEIANDKANEAKRARDEAERLNASKIATDYQRKLAAIDVQIADINLSIANINDIIDTISDEKEYERLVNLIKTYKTRILQLKLDKAKLKLEKI